MPKEFKLVYKYNDHEIEAGQNGWIPDKVIAEKILKVLSFSPIYYSKNIYLIERERKDPCTRKDMRTYKEHKVFNKDWFYMQALEPGDFVENEVIEDLMNCLPPACMRSSCFQFGEPVSHINGKALYHTFTCVDKDTWQYKGRCFRGKSQYRCDFCTDCIPRKTNDGMKYFCSGLNKDVSQSRFGGNSPQICPKRSE